MKRFVKPGREGLRVVIPGTNRQLRPEGEWVPWTQYFMRRRAVGDVADATPPAAAEPEAPKEPTPKKPTKRTR